MTSKPKKHRTKKDDAETEPVKKNSIISPEEWYNTLVQRYENLIKIANDDLPGLWDSLEFELSIQKILNIKDCTLPFAGIVLGRPSSLKTVGIELFRKWIHTFYTDNFSPRSFVSHSTVTREKLAEIDMLPKIKNNLFLTPELSPTFSKKDDELIDVLGILTRVLDGHGYESDTGAHGHRGYNEPMMFTWVGAAVDIPYKVHKFLGTLGPKLYFLRLPSNSKNEDEYFDDLDKDFGDKLTRVRSALYDYLNWFELCPDIQRDKENMLGKIAWDSDRENNPDSIKAKKYIIKLAILLAHLRAVVPTWETSDPSSQGLDYAYALATIEDPSRAITKLRNLARRHALSQGRNYITLYDIPLLIKVVFSTASQERVRVFELLIEYGGSLTTSRITESLNTSNNTAKRTMAELKAVGIVDVGDSKVEKIVERNGQPVSITYLEKQITLKDAYYWFISKDFSGVRNLPPYYANKQTTTLVGLGGHFSYTYSKSVLLNSILPRLTKQEHSQTCQICGETLDPDPYYAKMHRCEGTDYDVTVIISMKYCGFAILRAVWSMMTQSYD